MTEAHTPSHGVGIIGLGAMGREMLAAMQAHPRFTVRAVWDPDAAAMHAALDDQPALVAGRDALDVITTTGVDVLYIASPPNTHAALAHLALDHGLALFCEKPLGVDLQTSRHLVARVNSQGALNAVNFNHAAAFDAQTVKRWLDAGELGTPSHVVMHLHLPQWPRPFQAHARWLAGREQGGFSREMLSHWLFLTRKLLGEGRLLHAHTRYAHADRDGGAGSEVAVSAEFEFAGVAVCIIAAVGGVGPIGMEYTLFATDSSVRLSSGGGLQRWQNDGWRDCAANDEAPGGDRGRALTQFAALLASQPNTCASMADALAVQEWIEGMLQGC